MTAKDKTKAFWDDQAREHGASDLATAPDHHYRTLEINSIIRVIEAIKKRETILDVGCGNGYSTVQIGKKFPEAIITGVDYSEPMIAEANRTVIPNVEYFHGNVLTLSRNKNLLGQKFDIVLSTRCLINLSTWEEQKAGILEMLKMLTPDGRLILVENTEAGLASLNTLRAKLGLHAIEVRWHNKYLPQKEFTEFMADAGGDRFEIEHVENIGNLYYIASRVIYAKLCKDQGIEPDYNHPINAIAAELPSLGQYYACSPNFMFVLRKLDDLE
jgi:ubiquinone/menaquinone biosynthesis C-methylase UbiE